MYVVFLPLENVKAYFKRAKAHAAVWNEKEARMDFQRVVQLDPSLAAAVRKELKILGERMRKKHVEDRKRYKGIFQETKRETEEEGLSEENEEPSGTHEEEGKEEALKMEERQEEGEGNRETEGGMTEKENTELKSTCRGESAPQKEVGIGMEERDHGQERDSGEGATGGDSSGPKEQAGVGPHRSEEERDEINLVAQAQNGVVGGAALEGEHHESVIHGGSGENEGEVPGDPTTSVVEKPVLVRCEGEDLSIEREEEEAERREGEFNALHSERVHKEMGAGAENHEEEAQVATSEGGVEEGCFQVQQNRLEGEAGGEAELALRAQTPDGGEREGPRKQSSPREKEEEAELGKSKMEAASEPEGGLKHHEMEGRGVGAGDCRVEGEGNLGNPEEKANCGKKKTQLGCSCGADEAIQRDEVGQEYAGAETGFRSEDSPARRRDEDSEVEQAERDLEVHQEGPEMLEGRSERTEYPLSTQISNERSGEKQGTMSPMRGKEDNNQTCFLVQVAEPVVSSKQNNCPSSQPVPTEEDAGEKYIK